MNYLVYGDIIQSRQKSVEQIQYFWNIFKPLNKNNEFVVPFIPILGDAFHGVVANKSAALKLIQQINDTLSDKGLEARYVLVPVRGDFTLINTERKFLKMFRTSCCNPLNVPELVLADKELKKMKKGSKKVRLLETLSIHQRSKHHTLMTREYI